MMDQITEARVANYLRRWEIGFGAKHHGKQMRLTDSENWSKWPSITRGLVSRGYSDQETWKILGGNVLRLLGEAIG